MSKLSRQFQVPDELANLYDFANTLDVRRFIHHGVPHPQDDELKSVRELGAWMSQRGLFSTGAKITAAMFETALELRSCVRDYLQCDPVERRKNKNVIGPLNKALKLFPLVAEAGRDGGMALK